MDHANYARKKPKRKHEKHNCCVPQCPEYKNPSNFMHRVPSDPVRRKKWAVAIKTGKELTINMLVCSRHFTKLDYLPSRSKRPCLKKIAVPNQNLPIRSHEKPQTSPVKRKNAARADRAKKRTMWACEEHNELERAESFDSRDSVGKMQSFQWADHADELLRRVNVLYGGNEIFDCEVDCFDGLIQGHRLILAACSPYLMNEFKQNCGNGCILLKGVKCSAVRKVFDFMYRGHVDVPSSEVTDVLEAAKLLQITSLERYYSLNKSDYKNNKISPENKYALEQDVHLETESIVNEPFEAVYVECEMPDSAQSDTENQIPGEGATVFGTELNCEHLEGVESKIEIEEFGEEGFESSGHDTPPCVDGLKVERAVEDYLPVSTSPGGSSCGLGAFQSDRNVQKEELNSQSKTSTKSSSSCSSNVCGELQFPVEGLNELVPPTSNVEVLSCNINGIGKELLELGNKVLIRERDHVAIVGKETAAHVENTAHVLGNISLPPIVSHGAGNVELHRSFVLEALENPGMEKEGHMKNDCKELLSTGVSNGLENCTNEESTKRWYVCGVCGQQFETSKEFDIHLRTHIGETPQVQNRSGDMPHTCRECGRMFARRSSLLKHSRTHYQESKKPGKTFLCSVCSSSFGTKLHLGRHMYSHTGVKPFPCSQCDKQFMSNHSLKLHFRIHTGKDSEKPHKRHECSVCAKTYSRRCSLLSHFRTHTGEKPFVCSVCGAAFTRKSDLRMHMFRHSAVKPFPCSQCDKQFRTKYEMKNHFRVHSNLNIDQMCQASYSCSDDLKQPMAKQAGVEKGISCNICGKSFICDLYLMRHMMRVHYADKRFECDHCGAKFPVRERLVRHIMSRHNVNREFKCTSCPSSFKSLSALGRHMRVHTGEKPYVCSYCNSAFADHRNLIVHRRIHTGERPFVCQVCGSGFRESTGFIIHMRGHTGERPFKCDHCEKSFVRKQRLKEHILVHTGVKPHVCDTCGKGFRLGSSLTKHKLSHTGERPYLCSHCGQTYRLRKSLRVHMKQKHPCGKEVAAGSVE